MERLCLLRLSWIPALLAMGLPMARHLRSANATVAMKVEELRQEMHREFGLTSRLAASVLGPLMLWSSRREERRLANGFRYEPQTIVERRNWA